MQLKKQVWKRLRKHRPCLGCGRDHATILCLTRRGWYRDGDDKARLNVVDDTPVAQEIVDKRK